MRGNRPKNLGIVATTVPSFQNPRENYVSSQFAKKCVRLNKAPVHNKTSAWKIYNLKRSYMASKNGSQYFSVSLVRYFLSTTFVFVQNNFPVSYRFGPFKTGVVYIQEKVQDCSEAFGNCILRFTGRPRLG